MPDKREMFFYPHLTTNRVSQCSMVLHCKILKIQKTHCAIAGALLALQTPTQQELVMGLNNSIETTPLIQLVFGTVFGNPFLPALQW